ncbi:MAG: nicotinate (nicotinamide) nucleotide adenylyltransferase [Clostridiales bacterium]|nr:nicotinate (nicotinamide) nucleotide adenylyltransferase [Clostridiales bacterium]
MEKIAFYGGSFNPPNIIHYEIAKTVINELNIDKLFFVPVGNYYKKSGLIDVKHRYNMLKEMCCKDEKIFVSDISLEEKKNIKAIDMFRKLELKYNNSENYYIMGADNFQNIMTWKESEELLKNFKIIIIQRDNIDINYFINKYEIIANNKNNLYIINKNEEFLYDSSIIRNSIKRNIYLEGSLDENVKKYIDDNGLYRD